MEIVTFLKEFAKNNGATSVIVLVLTVVITNLIKIPIKKHATKIATLAQKSGFNVSERFITSTVVYIPFGVTLGLFCIADGIGVAFGRSFDFVGIMARTPIIAAASIGLYSLITNTIDKAAQKSEYKEFVKSQIAEPEPEPAEVKTATPTATPEPPAAPAAIEPTQTNTPN